MARSPDPPIIRSSDHPMPVTIVIGAQWGDEGKGKVVDLLAPEVDVVARYQGGANAGHTIAWGGGEDGAPARQFVLHLIDRKSTRLNSSHVKIAYAVFCLKKKE